MEYQLKWDLGEKMKKVVIVGAGPAGLTAAYTLLKDGNDEFDVTVLEAERQVGGISKTVRYNDNRMDLRRAQIL